MMESMRLVLDKALHEINIGKAHVENCIAIQEKKLNLAKAQNSRGQCPSL